MQYLTFKNIYQFARVPMIKFLGPRHLLTKKEQTKQSSSGISNFSTKTQGAGIIIPSIKAPFLKGFQMDTVNSGGFVDESYQKVKSISLKK